MEKSIKLLAIALVICALLFSAAEMLSTRYVLSFGENPIVVLDTWTGSVYYPWENTYKEYKLP